MLRARIGNPRNSPKDVVLRRRASKSSFGVIKKKIHVPYDHYNHRLGFFVIQWRNSFDNCTRLSTSAPMHNVLVTCQRETFLATMLAYLLLYKCYVTYTCVLLTTLDYVRCCTRYILCSICIKQPCSSTIIFVMGWLDHGKYYVGYCVP